MRIKRTTPHGGTRHGGTARRNRMVAVVSGLIAATALSVPSASADPPAPAYTPRQLADVGDAVLAADVAGTAWYVDTETNTLVVTADSTVSSSEIDRIREHAGDNAGALRVERTPGRLTKLLSGGDAIYTTSWRCSAGFNVRSGSTYYLLTAGHCTSGAGDWFTDSAHSTLIGPTAGSSFPGNDYGLVQYTNPVVSHPGDVGGVDITGATDATVGMPVTRRGSTTGVHSGTVTGVDATVNYGGGDVVYGLIRTDVCAEPGDSGGPLYSGSQAVGLTSGGSGDCTTGGTTYFQPVTEALSAYGVSVY